MWWSRAFVLCLFILQLYQIWGVTGWQSICNLPKVTGPCRAAIPRWYFNRAKGICERFIYGGCRGNPNNFRTKRDCERKCGGRTCRARVDLAFIIDGSRSIEHYGRGNFRRCLHFVKAIVRRFYTDNRQTRVAVVLFSSKSWLIFRFGQYRSKSQLLRKISRIRYPRGGSKTGKAMRFTLRHVFRHARRGRGVRKVAIVMTDGKSQDNVLRPAQRFLARRIRCYAVGIGHKFNRHQLLQIAGGNRKHVLTAGFRSLHTIIRSIGRRVCRGAIRPVLPTLPHTRPVSRLPSGSVSHIPITADIAFLIDGSRYVGRWNFHREKAFIKSIARRFTIGKHHSHIGVATYGRRPHLRMRFNQYGSLRSVRGALNSIRYPNQRGRRVDVGMWASLRYFFSRRIKYSFVRKILVVLVSGRQTRPSPYIIRRLPSLFRRLGVQVYVVGIGRIDHRYLRPITYRNRHVYIVHSYNSLVTRAGSIARVIHKEMRIEQERYYDQAMSKLRTNDLHHRPNDLHHRPNSTNKDCRQTGDVDMDCFSQLKNGTQLKNVA